MRWFSKKPATSHGESMKRHWQTAAQGQTLFEFALVLPVLFLLIFGAIDFGRAVAIYNSLANAARQGAQYAQTNDIKSCAISDGQNTCEAVRTYALAGAPLVSTSAVSLTVTYNSALPNVIFDPISGSSTLRSWTVTVSYTFHPIISSVFNRLTLPFSNTALVVGN